jgi:hypothetical protein
VPVQLEIGRRVARRGRIEPPARSLSRTLDQLGGVPEVDR